MGPLGGVRVLELAGIGPGPHTAMMLADLGAEVIRVARPGESSASLHDSVLRSRTLVTADLKNTEDVARVRELARHADVLLEGFRPGVAERLGIGPDILCAENSRLIYVRITGWGQDGPFSPRAGHDINYVSLTGALDVSGLKGQRPTIPVNFVGDYGGGSTFAVVGVLAALFERASSGQGQVVDAAMVDGVSVLAQQISSLWHTQRWSRERGTNTIDTGAPFYDTYECRDGKYFAVGATEPQFYAQLLQGLGLNAMDLPDQSDKDGWPELRRVFAQTFRSRTRDEWAAVFADVDACATPVLNFSEAAAHPHLLARRVYDELDEITQAMPAPRFDRTPLPEPRGQARAASLSAAVDRWNS